MRVLIVKMSSMGDIIHTLPALSDARRACPDLLVDWVVEEAFAEIPTWHPSVDQVLPIALRRWRKNWIRSWRSGEIRRFREQLKRRHYDRIIDAQGLLKSAWVSRMAEGSILGLDRQSAREPLASRFYQRAIAVPRELHAVERLRLLFAECLDYRRPRSRVDYGLDADRIGLQGSAPGRPSLLFLHGTSWDNKRWPLEYWREMARLCRRAGYQVRLPWGNEAEQQRARQIAEGLPEVEILPRQSLSEMAARINESTAVVAMDTGLAHLAAALDVPCVTLYGPTDPGLSGTLGAFQENRASSLPCAPCMKRRCHYRGEKIRQQLAGESFEPWPPCFSDNPPDRVFEQLERLIARRQQIIAHGISI